MLRSLRRHHFARMKVKAVAIFRGWRGHQGPPYVKSGHFEDGVYRAEYMAPSDLSRAIAFIAGTHGRPCSCWGCKKGVPRDKRSVRIHEI